MEQKIEEMPKGIANFLKGKQPKQEIETPVAQTEETVTETETEVETTEKVEETPTTETPVAEATKEKVEDKEEAPVAEKQWFELDTPEKVEKENPTDGTPSVEEKAKILDGLLANPEVRYALENFKAGKSLSDISSEFQVVDYNKFDDEDIVKAYGAQLGLSPEEMEESLESFDSANPLQRKSLVKQYRSELETTQRSTMENRTNELRANAPDDSKVLQKFNDDIKREQDFMVGKDFYGVKMTEQDGEDFKEFCQNFDYFNPDGTYNVPLMRNFYLATKKMSKIQSVNFKNGKDEGSREVLKEVHRPTESTAAVNKLPTQKQPQTANEVARGAIKKMFGR